MWSASARYIQPARRRHQFTPAVGIVKGSLVYFDAEGESSAVGLDQLRGGADLKPSGCRCQMLHIQVCADGAVSFW